MTSAVSEHHSKSSFASPVVWAVPAAAALSLPRVVATGLEGTYAGVLTGALLASAGIVGMAWRWFDVARDVR